MTVRGASGSGKSSLLNILGCLDTPTGGTYKLDGVDVSHQTDEERSHTRNRKIGFVFQSFNLLPRTTAAENVEIPALYAGGTVDRRRALAILERVGLGSRADHYVTELSGGEQQRVAIARAVANAPLVLLADEPTGNLDPETAGYVFEALEALARQSGLAALIATHNHELAGLMDRRVTIEDGKVVEMN